MNTEYIQNSGGNLHFQTRNGSCMRHHSQQVSHLSSITSVISFLGYCELNKYQQILLHIITRSIWKKYNFWLVKKNFWFLRRLWKWINIVYFYKNFMFHKKKQYFVQFYVSKMSKIHKKFIKRPKSHFCLWKKHVLYNVKTCSLLLFKVSFI